MKIKIVTYYRVFQVESRDVILVRSWSTPRLLGPLSTLTLHGTTGYSTFFATVTETTQGWTFNSASCESGPHGMTSYRKLEPQLEVSIREKSTYCGFHNLGRQFGTVPEYETIGGSCRHLICICLRRSLDVGDCDRNQVV